MAGPTCRGWFQDRLSWTRRVALGSLGLAAQLTCPPAGAQAVVEQTSAHPVGKKVVETRPKVVPYEEGKAIPSGYVVQKQPRTSLLLAGGIVLAAGYGASYVIGAVHNGRLLSAGEAPSLAYYTLYIPVAGPLVGLQTIEPNTAESVALITSAALQIGGGVAVLVGLGTHDKRLVRVGGVDLGVGVSAGRATLVGHF